MEPKYDHSKVESKIYKMWETGGYFKPAGDPKKKPFSILLPPPNANADLHFGHCRKAVIRLFVQALAAGDADAQNFGIIQRFPDALR